MRPLLDSIAKAITSRLDASMASLSFGMPCSMFLTFDSHTYRWKGYGDHGGCNEVKWALETDTKHKVGQVPRHLLKQGCWCLCCDIGPDILNH